MSAKGKRKRTKRTTSPGPLTRMFQAVEEDLRRLDEAGVEPWDEDFVTHFSEALELDKKDWLHGEWVRPWERYRELIHDVYSAEPLRPFVIAWNKMQTGLAEDAAWSLVNLLKPIEEAMKHRDENFFVELLRLAKRLFRQTFETRDVQLLELVFTMRREMGKNPTRAEVKAGFLATGTKVDDKDWSKYFKRCRLEFLAKGKRTTKKKSAKAK